MNNVVGGVGDDGGVKVVVCEVLSSVGVTLCGGVVLMVVYNVCSDAVSCDGVRVQSNLLLNT